MISLVASERHLSFLLSISSTLIVFINLPPVYLLSYKMLLMIEVIVATQPFSELTVSTFKLKR